MAGTSSCFPRAKTACFVWFIFTVAVGTPSLHAAEDGPTPEQRLNAVSAAYRGLEAYGDQGELVMNYSRAAARHTIRVPVPLWYVRAERIVWDATVTGVVADKERVTVVNNALTSPFYAFIAEEFLGNPQPPPLTRSVSTVRPPDEQLAQLLQLAGPTLLEVLATLVCERHGVERLRERSKSVVAEPDQILDGRRAQVVVLQPRNQAPPIRLWIDPATTLLRRMEFSLPRQTGHDATEAIEGDDLGDASIIWTAGLIVTDREQVSSGMDIAERNRLAQTMDTSVPVYGRTPVPPVPSKALPPVPSKSLPTPPIAPSKTAPTAQPSFPPLPELIAETSAADAASRLHLVAVSFIFVQPSGQSAAPVYVQTPSSLFQKLLRRAFPPERPRPPSSP